MKKHKQTSAITWCAYVGESFGEIGLYDRGGGTWKLQNTHAEWNTDTIHHFLKSTEAPGTTLARTLSTVFSSACSCCPGHLGQTGEGSCHQDSSDEHARSKWEFVPASCSDWRAQSGSRTHHQTKQIQSLCSDHR